MSRDEALAVSAPKVAPYEPPSVAFHAFSPESVCELKGRPYYERAISIAALCGEPNTVLTYHGTRTLTYAVAEKLRGMGFIVGQVKTTRFPSTEEMVEGLLVKVDNNQYSFKVTW